MEDNYDPDKYIPGHYKCDQCGFVNVRKVINVAAGVVGSLKTTEAVVCPNDGKLLRMMTWMEYSEDQEKEIAALKAQCDGYYNEAADGWKKFRDAEREITALKAELAKCGKENCMGHAVGGVRQWVSKERLDAVKADLRAVALAATKLRQEFWTIGRQHYSRDAFNNVLVPIDDALALPGVTKVMEE